MQILGSEIPSQFKAFWWQCTYSILGAFDSMTKWDALYHPRSANKNPTPQVLIIIAPRKKFMLWPIITCIKGLKVIPMWINPIFGWFGNPWTWKSCQKWDFKRQMIQYKECLTILKLHLAGCEPILINFPVISNEQDIFNISIFSLRFQFFQFLHYSQFLRFLQFFYKHWKYRKNWKNWNFIEKLKVLRISSSLDMYETFIFLYFPGKKCGWIVN